MLAFVVRNQVRRKGRVKPRLFALPSLHWLPSVCIHFKIPLFLNVTIAMPLSIDRPVSSPPSIPADQSLFFFSLNLRGSSVAALKTVDSPPSTSGKVDSLPVFKAAKKTFLIFGCQMYFRLYFLLSGIVCF